MKNNVIKLIETDEMFERLYVRPHDEWLKINIGTFFKYENEVYISKRSGKWIIKKIEDKWLVTDKEGLLCVGYPVYVERCLDHIKDLDEFYKYQKPPLFKQNIIQFKIKGV